MNVQVAHARLPPIAQDKNLLHYRRKRPIPLVKSLTPRMKISPTGGFRLRRLRRTTFYAPGTVKRLGGNEPLFLVDHPATVRHFTSRLGRMHPTKPVGLTNVHEDPLSFRFRQYFKPTLYSLESFRIKAVVHELFRDLSYQQRFPQKYSRKSILAAATNNRHRDICDDRHLAQLHWFRLSHQPLSPLALRPTEQLAPDTANRTRSPGPSRGRTQCFRDHRHARRRYLV